MSYTPHTWASGETITAAKLNALEQGVAEGGGGAIIYHTYDVDNGTIEDDTLIPDEMDSGARVVIVWEDAGYKSEVIFWSSTMLAFYNYEQWGVQQYYISSGEGGD